MPALLLALFAGTLFGAGLAFSGMADPARVRAFLDIFGSWDMTLAFVMGGALIPMALAWIIQRRMHAPLAASAFHLPETQRLDLRLILGSALFGMGWGVAGLCPGPVLANLALTPLPAAIFVAALVAGMALERLDWRPAVRHQAR